MALLCAVSAQPLFAQSSRKIRTLQSQRNALQKQINESETLLKSTRKDVRSQLSTLSVLNGQIDRQKAFLSNVQSEVDVLNHNLDSLTAQLRVLQSELNERKRSYSRSVLYLYRNRSSQNKLMFIFSAENFSQMYRRLRYVREYAGYQRMQGEQLQEKRRQVWAKEAELRQVRTQKKDLLDRGQIEQERMEKKQKEHQTVVNSLQKKQKQLQSTIQTNKKKYSSLNAQIDRLIQQEIAAAEKRRKEEEARRRRELERKRRAITFSPSVKGKGGKGSASGQRSTSSSGKEKDRPVPEFEMERADRVLSGNFAANKGCLPIPITGPYVVSSRYGQYRVSGLRGVQLDNKGINITGKRGARARAVFNGEVSAIFSFGGFKNVMVRHGSYISIYCNLSSVSVRRGQRVSTRDVLGTVAPDEGGNCTLHFQLRKETAKLNPESWLTR